MKKLIILLLISFTAFSNGYSKTKQELIRELFKVMHQDSAVDRAFKTMMPLMLKQAQTQQKDPAKVAMMQERIKTQIPLISGILKRMMDEDIVPLYEKYYSKKVIKDCIKYYKSPSGQKFIKTAPLIQKEMMGIMYQKYMPEIQKAVKEKMGEPNEKENK